MLVATEIAVALVVIMDKHPRTLRGNDVHHAVMAAVDGDNLEAFDVYRRHALAKEDIVAAVGLIDEGVVVKVDIMPVQLLLAEVLTAEVKRRPVVLHGKIEAANIAVQALVDSVVVTPCLIPFVTQPDLTGHLSQRNV